MILSPLSPQRPARTESSRSALARYACGLLALLTASATYAQTCDTGRILTADVVAFDMPIMFNRLGAQNVNGMMYALRRDVVTLDADGMPNGLLADVDDADLQNFTGKVSLRPDKRPRPLVLRMGAGDCMTLTLTNLLREAPNPFNNASPGAPVIRSGIEFTVPNDDQVAPRNISLRFQGTEIIDGSPGSDGVIVGDDAIAGQLAAPGETATYTFYAPNDGGFVGVSYGGVNGGEGLGGTTASGLFAVLNVGPAGASFYRSLVTNEELELVSSYDENGNLVIDYEAEYANVEPWLSEGKAGLPILNMIQDGEIVHSALDAIVAFGGDGFQMQAPGGDPEYSYLGHFPPETYPLESVGLRNPTVPNRLEPFREFTVAFHDEAQTTQAFPRWFNDPVFQHTLHGVKDAFMINYGSGGIGSEIIANRLGVGAMHDCLNCAYEEFFLTFHAVGEVGQLTDIPANAGLEECTPGLVNCEAVGPKANYVLYPDDPSNVHHGYVGDATAFRNVHIGPGEQHVFHLHNHQWLFNADDDNSNYLDAQGLGPGSGYGYWINFGGAGNRNKTAGDAIFHCHFYPHFAQGMWEMWRIHDTFEPGTEVLAQEPTVDVDEDEVLERVSFMFDGLGMGNGTPAPGARALPDGEIVAGAPTPAVIPLPGKAMPPMPADFVFTVPNGNTVQACMMTDAYDNKTTVAREMDGSCPDIEGVALESRPVGSLTRVARTNADRIFYGLASAGAGPNGPRYAYGGDGDLGTADDVNPGYPFWIAGMEHTVGNRPPTPPLDMITFDQAQDLKDSGGALWQNAAWDYPLAIDGWDGGLPRFGVEGFSAGGEAEAAISRLDMSKDIHLAKPVFFPEEGTDLERIAMAYHATRCHDSARIEKDGAAFEAVPAYCEEDIHTTLPDGSQEGVPAGVGLATNANGNNSSHTIGGFLTNGGLPIAGAPYMEPCMDDRGVGMYGYDQGHFFDGGTLNGQVLPIWDSRGMSTLGLSPFSSLAPRVYKAANVQFDAVLNKLGYHFPQQRIITLWDDVIPTINQERPPEPFVMRLNTFDCAQYVHSNVVPKAYELDDYQIRTPTDIIGQHIHLPKWDLTSADGSANGWNYEDGTLSPEAVMEVIHAINEWNMLHPTEAVVTVFEGGNPDMEPAYPRYVEDSAGNTLGDDQNDILLAMDVSHPKFGDRWPGQRNTMQRWFADPIVNTQGTDRGLGIIFTHDHYGPSTHQQVGLYATLLIEPAGSEWHHNETGTLLYNGAREDGGPTSWQAAILTGEDTRYQTSVNHLEIESHREFYLEYSDFQHAYQPGVYVGIGPDGDPIHPYDGQIDTAPSGLIDGSSIAGNETFRHAIQPPYRLEQSREGDPSAFPIDIWEFPTTCLGGAPRPCPEAITANDPGMYVVNYRNEPLAARIYDPDRPGPDAAIDQDCSNPLNRTGCGTQAAGIAGDLAYAMSSRVQRAIPELNTVMGLAPSGYFDGVCSNGVFCPPITSVDALLPGDPFTPMPRVFDGNRVHVKIQAGGQEEEHGATIHGLKWLQGGSGFGESKNSGWRNAQAGGISEQFTLRMPVFADFRSRGNTADYAYSINPSVDGWVQGTWGLIRTYKPSRSVDLYELPVELDQRADVANADKFFGVCPIDAPVRSYDITAISINDVRSAPDGLIELGDGGEQALIKVQDLFPDAHVGASPDPAGGTFIYNTRADEVEGGVAHGLIENSFLRGPLHDPTAIVYVMTEDLVAKRPGYVSTKGRNATTTPDDPYCWETDNKGKLSYEPSLAQCQVVLPEYVPLEPLVIRANAGDCIEIKLSNKVLQQAYIETGTTDEELGYDFGEDYLVFGWSAGEDAYLPLFEDGTLYADTDENEGELPEFDPTRLYADTNRDGRIDTDPASPTYDGAPVALASITFDETMDLANGNAVGAAVRRDPGEGVEGMTSFNNNLMQPSAHVGMRPQLVEYDITRSDGFNAGNNKKQTAAPGESRSYQWYAGTIDIVGSQGSQLQLAAEPIEFGGFNIMSADPIEQGQKGLVAAGVIYPQGSKWTVDPGTNTAATVYDGTTGELLFRDFTVIAAKGLSMSYADSFPVENQVGEGDFGVAEDSQDMGHMAINLGNEAMWFRYGVNPTNVAGNAACAGAEAGGEGGPAACLGGIGDPLANIAYHNSLVGEDPQTAVFPVRPGDGFRMHVLMPFAPGRGSTFDLHGHTFQRDPYVCEGDWDQNLEGKCAMDALGLPGSGSVGSQSLGNNPQGFHLGGIESWFAAEHYEIVIPSASEGQGAGGRDGVEQDYLFRDHMGIGNTAGLWGIVRVDAAAPYEGGAAADTGTTDTGTTDGGTTDGGTTDGGTTDGGNNGKPGGKKK